MPGHFEDSDPCQKLLQKDSFHCGDVSNVRPRKEKATCLSNGAFCVLLGGVCRGHSGCLFVSFLFVGRVTGPPATNIFSHKLVLSCEVRMVES